MHTQLFVGVDTHKDSHTAAILDSYFGTLATLTFANNYKGFSKFAEKLEKIAKGKTCLFGLEDSQGLGSFLGACPRIAINMNISLKTHRNN